MNRRIETAHDRFLARIDRQPGGCWLWLGNVMGNGYGRHYPGGSGASTLAHRYAYETFIGPIPDGLQIDHRCRNKLCVNPDHLEAVTAAENMRRADVALGVRSCKARCPRGHVYSVENTYTNPRTGKRTCRTCLRASNARYELQRRERRHGAAAA